jgi:hypothetical protein
MDSGWPWVPDEAGDPVHCTDSGIGIMSVNFRVRMANMDDHPDPVCSARNKLPPTERSTR